MQGLTERQAAVLDYIRLYLNEMAYSPTVREIGARMGISSTNGVSDHLRALERKGYIRRIDMTARGIRLNDGRPEPSPKHDQGVCPTCKRRMRKAL